MTLRALSDTLRPQAERIARDRASITASTDRLAELLDDGTINDRQYDAVWRDEPDDDALADPWVLMLWAMQLRRHIARPREIGVHWEAFTPTYRCRGACADTGLVHVVDDEERHWSRPCAVCRPRWYQCWRDRTLNPAHHTCGECDGSRHGRRYSAAGNGREEKTHVEAPDPLDSLT